MSIRLFRGVSRPHFDRTAGMLTPKIREEFAYTWRYGEEHLVFGSGAVFGRSHINAVIRHELHQNAYPTSGISTTPSFSRAQFYALAGGTELEGFVFVLDQLSLVTSGVTAYRVADFATRPSVPEDDEVILVHRDHWTLPEEIIVDILPVYRDRGALSTS